MFRVKFVTGRDCDVHADDLGYRGNFVVFFKRKPDAKEEDEDYYIMTVAYSADAIFSIELVPDET